MDAGRFDLLAKGFARDVSRRTAVRRFGVSLATIAGVTRLSSGRALAQDAPAADQQGDEEPEGPVEEVPSDTQPLRGRCQPHSLGCKDFDGDGICTANYLTADCEVVEGRECRCPPPPPTCRCQRICTSASGETTTTDISCRGTGQSAEAEGAADAPELVGGESPLCCDECDVICDACPPGRGWAVRCRACVRCLRLCDFRCNSLPGVEG
jgi:hypothetical protein